MSEEAERELLTAYWLADIIRSGNYMDQRAYLLRHINRAYKAISGADIPTALGHDEAKDAKP